ncbi:fibronectin type III domain-containing protein [Streptomyces sp. NPDC047928]|uniref:fibronectin type III domain-containing protein n=1 Tax=unclassified Streptomyces TaxID=2593676 RepID=UPI003721B672
MAKRLRASRLRALRPRAVRTAAAVIGTATLTSLVLPVTSANAAVTCAPNVWRVQFFANTTLSGTPRLTGCDAAINENYGLGDPAGVTLPKDNFSGRWTVSRDFGSGGPFTLNAAVQDGIRVYVDGVRKIDMWRNVSTTQRKSVNLTIPRGRHTIRVDFVAYTGAASVGFTYVPRTSATVDKVAPLAPTGVTAAYDRTALRTTLRWRKNAEMDLGGYRVYRRTGSAAYAQVGTATAAATTFLNTPPATGAAYQYVVRAVDKAGNLGPASSAVSVTSEDRTPPPAPANPTATVDTGSVRVAWQAAAGATGYRVHRSDAATGPFTAVSPLGATLSDTAYRDLTADIKQRWYYRVTAFDAAGNESAPSVTTDTGEPDTTPPAQVSGLTATSSTAGNTLKWTRNTDDTVHYEVWAAPLGDEDPDGPSVTTGDSFTDAAASSGIQYAYRVFAVDAYGNTSPMTGVLAIRPAPANVLPPTNVTAAVHTDSTAVSWTNPADQGVRGYRAYRRTTTDGAWTAYAYTIGGYGAADVDAPAGYAEYYVVSLDQNGRESAPSGIAKAVRQAAAVPYTPRAPQVTLLPPHTVCVLSSDCEAHKGPLTFTMAPHAAEPDRPLTGYRWRIAGFNFSTSWVTTTDTTVTWEPPMGFLNGTYSLLVEAVDANGSGATTNVYVKWG